MEKSTTECGNGCKQVVVNMGCYNGGTATADITIGENGNWFINGEDTGVQAQGPKGDKGDAGSVGPQGEIGPQGPQGIQGPKGSLSAEVLFEGKADIVGIQHSLAKPISEYPLLVVEIRVHLTGKPDSEFIKHQDVVPSPQISHGGEVSYTRIVTTTGGAINWYFDTDTGFTVGLINMPVTGVDDICISKIYGYR